jgi:hypothetical protein
VRAACSARPRTEGAGAVGGSVAGGIVTRGIESGGDVRATFDAKRMALDGASGGVGLGIGKAIGKAVSFFRGSVSRAGSEVVATATEQARKRLALPPMRGQNPWVGEIRSEVTTKEMTMFRVWGDESGQVSGWLTPTAPSSRLGAIRDLALPPMNSAEWLSEVRGPAGTRIQIGTAAKAFGQPGGGPQILLLDNIPRSSFGPGIPLGAH